MQHWDWGSQIVNLETPWISKLTKTPILPNCLQNGSKMAHRIFSPYYMYFITFFTYETILVFWWFRSRPKQCDVYNAKEKRSRIIMLTFCSIYDGLYICCFFLLFFFSESMYSQKYMYKFGNMFNAFVFCTPLFIILIICAFSENSIITKKLPATYKHSGTRLIDHTLYWPGNWYWHYKLTPLILLIKFLKVS